MVLTNTMVPFSSSICEDLAWSKVVRTEEREERVSPRERVRERREKKGMDVCVWVQNVHQSKLFNLLALIGSH